MSRTVCVKCGQAPRPGDFYVEVQQAAERDGVTVITRGVAFLLAHLECPPPAYPASADIIDCRSDEPCICTAMRTMSGGGPQVFWICAVHGHVPAEEGR